jgi:hypothetical protein
MSMPYSNGSCLSLQVRYAADDVLYLHHLHQQLGAALTSPIQERVRPEEWLAGWASSRILMLWWC